MMKHYKHSFVVCQELARSVFTAQIDVRKFITLLATTLFISLGFGPAMATEFLVNTTTLGGQSFPSIATLANGDVVIAWEDGSNPAATNIRAQRFDASGVAQGDEFVVNTTTASHQLVPSVAALSVGLGGGFVITWQDNSQTGGDVIGNAIRAQRFDRFGVPLGAEFLVNSTTASDQNNPVAIPIGGGFAIAWTDNSATGDDTSSSAVRVQRFSSVGVPLGVEFVANTTTDLFQFGPAMATFADGGFIVTWTDGSQTGADVSGNAIRARRFAANGVPQGAEFLVNTTTTGVQSVPSVAVLSGGEYVISWQDGSQSGDDNSGFAAIRAQRFDAAGAKQGAEFLVNTTTADVQRNPAVAALGDGFVIVWEDNSQTGSDTSSFAVRAQRYTALGAKQGIELVVNTTTNGFQTQPAVTGVGPNGFITAWTDNSQVGDTDIRAGHFDIALPHRGEFVANTTTSGNQTLPDVATVSSGGFVITWQDGSSTGGDALGSAIRAQLFDAAGALQGAELLVNTTTIGSQTTPNVAALNGGGFVITWTSADTSLGGIWAQLFDAAGAKQGAEFPVNTITNRSQINPTVVALTGGGFVIAWGDDSGTSSSPTSFDVRAQLFNASGTKLGAEFLVNTTTAGNQQRAAIAALTDGGFVIAWDDVSSVLAQRYDASGIAKGIEFQVNTTTANNQKFASIAALADGGFVIAWDDNSQSGGDTDNSAIRAQRYDEDSTAQGGEFLVNTTTVSIQGVPDIAALGGGGFVVSWQDNSQSGDDVSGAAIRAQRFTASGTAQGSEFLVNTATGSNQSNPVMAAFANGAFIIAWEDSGQSIPDTDGSAIRADVFDIPLSQPLTLVSSVLPTARTGFFPGGPVVTVFATVINAGADLQQNCEVRVPGPGVEAVSVGYQLTDAANVPVGPANAAFDLAGGQARSFILVFTPTATNSGKDVFPNFVCDNASVGIIPGVNTAFLTITNVEGPDILSISSTITNNGIINVPVGGGNAMSASAVNIGAGDALGSADAAVVVTADTGSVALNVVLLWCETDSNAICINPAVAASTAINT
ncbi:FIG01023050: hypothetical protein, partial [hydrothermal vent metagenome]